MILEKKVIQKFKLSINDFNKKCDPKLSFLIKKKLQSSTVVSFVYLH